MSSIFGKNIKMSVFGESHGKGIGVVIDNFPSGIKYDEEFILNEMERRAPGRNELSTQRQEMDKIEILSGVFQGYTTGTPICAVIYNKDNRSKDYTYIKDNMRPGHADYSGYIRYQGFNDYRGGGHFSGRLTAPIVFAGALSTLVLEKKEVFIGSHIQSIGKYQDNLFDKCNVNVKELKALRNAEFPLINECIEENMRNEIISAKNNLDSIGGIIETAAINIPAGMGNPIFESIESHIASILFSIPAVKGVEFGAGFEITSMLGSEANDQYYYEDNKVKAYTNNNGGIIGGITNGMPIIIRTAIKPTPSIGKPQKSINIDSKINTEVVTTGRHDPCIVHRAVPVIDAAVAFAILDITSVK